MLRLMELLLDSKLELAKKKTAQSGLFFNGAQEGTRTLTPFGTRPSSVRVYQFHHLSD
jgi:hypothetical protein